LNVNGLHRPNADIVFDHQSRQLVSVEATLLV